MKTFEDIFNNYFSGTLSESDLREFEILLKTDPDFKEKFEFEKDVRAAIISEKKDNLRRGFQTIEKNRQAEKGKNSNLVKYLIAASVAILLGIVGFNYFNKPISNENLFAQNFEPYRNIIEPITRNNNQKNERQFAFESYEMGNYKKAVTSFEQLYKSSGETYYLFYIANAEMALGKNNEAIKNLETHQKYNDEFFEKSQWYLALAYLSNNQTEKAKILLKAISKNKTFNYKNAAAILEKL